MSDDQGGIERAKAALRRTHEDRAKVESLRPEVKRIAGRAARLKELNTFAELMFAVATTSPKELGS